MVRRWSFLSELGQFFVRLYDSSHCTKPRSICQKFLKGAISFHQIYKLQTRKVEQSALKRKEDKICKRTESELRRGKN